MAAADDEYRCFVGGLSWSTDDRSLKDAFRPFGQVSDSKVVNDRETGRSRGFGFVTFTDEQSMRDAIEGMNGRDLDGRNITVNRAQARGGGSSSSGGGFRSGGGGYGGETRRTSGDYGGGRERSERGYGGGSRNGGGGGYGGGSRHGGGGGSDDSGWRS